MNDVVLFLCTGNSCRSQMAEGFLRAWAGDRFEVHSAGSQPKANIHPLAIEVMREIGIDIQGQSPKGVDQYFGRTAVHHVIFVCPRAEKKCPYLYPGVFDRQTWPFEDPAAFVGSPQATLISLIPTTTGSATAIGLIYPELNGKLNGVAVRVPLLNASLTDCVFEVKRKTTVDEVNRQLKEAADGSLRGILGYETRPLVSVDFLNDPRSAIVDAPSTMVIDDTQVKILAWYDNEFGYVNRMMELARKVASTL